MALRATPTIAICLTAGIAAGVALARPAGQSPPSAQAPAPAPVAAPVSAPAERASGAEDSPYLVDDGVPAPVGGDDSAPAPAPVGISIEGFAFSPPDAVAGGSPIAVTNLDGAEHTLTAVDGAFDTGSIGQGQSVSFAAPTAPGTYEFFCAIHPSMTGQLVVS